MPAMHGDVLNDMEINLHNMFEKMKVLLPAFSMSHRECLELCAPSKHIDMLIDAAVYAEVIHNSEWMRINVPDTVDDVYNPPVWLMMRTHAQKEPPLRPRFPTWQPGAGGSERVISWLTARMVLGRKFGLAQYVLDQLNELCDTGAQMRYIWPVCIHLVQNSDKDRTKAWADKHATFKPCRFLPQVSPQLKSAIRDSAALITSAVLVGDDHPAIEKGEVDIDAFTQSFFTYEGTNILRK